MDKKQFEEDLDKRLTARGLIDYAWHYFRTFEDIHAKYPKFTERYEVKYYLLCHAVELAMKAFLRECGYSRKRLVDIGHDLEKLIQELHKNDVTMSVDTMIQTITANQYYKTKQFEYPQTGFKQLPNLDDMRDSTYLLLSMTTHKITKEFPRIPEQREND